VSFWILDLDLLSFDTLKKKVYLTVSESINHTY